MGSVTGILRIRGMNWPVHVLGSKHIETEMDNEVLVDVYKMSGGIADYSQTKILLNSGQGQEQRRSILMHEILHAALPGLPEEDVAEVATALFTILRDNSLLDESAWGQLTRDEEGASHA